ncbi:replication-associated protein [Sewage-associated circular DNA virus-34]|uniref:replication-associated protein n=1 Tax=Sewage-associated circular DNA virus-34 TaxID=1592101 RepID=UPI000585E51B|nr:replication-associated protein [Sewage-associated circular DNA virus-34]AJD07563.1 replication-associated protein [Sewage-associated circular DNA virus-34]
MSKPLRNICFTSFNLDIEWFETEWPSHHLPGEETGMVQYIIVQGEFCKEGKKHIQGYAQLRGQYYLKKIKEFFGDNGLHVEPRRGTHEQARDYCKQEKNGRWHDYVEMGDQKKPGSRTDLLDVIDKIKEGETIASIISNSRDPKMVRNAVVYNRTLTAIEKQFKYDAAIKEAIKEYDGVTWRKWQEELLCYVDKDADKRKVRWYTDMGGNTGKSYITTYLTLLGKAYVVSGGKQADILYAYEDQPIVIYDLARAYEQNMDHIYVTMEYFKNGRFLSTKYESKMRVFKRPHVIVMANFPPHINKLSEDRWDIVYMTNP